MVILGHILNKLIILLLSGLSSRKEILFRSSMIRPSWFILIRPVIRNISLSWPLIRLRKKIYTFAPICVVMGIPFKLWNFENLGNCE